MSLDYKSSGVDIDADSESVNRIKSIVKTTHTNAVLTGLGSFGAIYNLSQIKNYKNPVLIQSIDGVGTKVKIASMVGKYETLGEDIVNHSCNDIVCQGAKPLTFLDYIASYKTEPQIIEEIVSGMAKACREAAVSLIGGETAEMTNVYAPNERDIAGCITGVVEKEKLITGNNIKEGDVILGLASSGLHTNGFSLVRKIFFDLNNFPVTHKFAELDAPLGEELLKPHRNYTKSVLGVLEKFEVKGLAHITGGGLIENVPRILPDGLSAEIKKGSWPVWPIFSLMQKLGQVAETEMFRVFNMGLGMILVVAAAEVERIVQAFGNSSENTYVIGRIVKGERKTILI